MSVPPGLRIQRITPLCQLQDLGRFGYQRFGVSRSGAMDPYSLRLANILVGNPQGGACLEFALAGAVFEVTAQRLHFAFVGHFPILINDELFPPNASYTLERGERLEVGASDASVGTHGYLAVLGGFNAKPQLGSCATHLRSGIGGFGAVTEAQNRGEGTRSGHLQALLSKRMKAVPANEACAAPTTTLRRQSDHDRGEGAAPTTTLRRQSDHDRGEGGAPTSTLRRHPDHDRGEGAAPTGKPRPLNLAVGAAPRREIRSGVILPTMLDEAPLAVERTLPEQLLRNPADTIRAVRGPQTEHFSDEVVERFFGAPWHIAPESDRMGFRLAGGTVTAENAGSMISEAVSPGSVQIPAGGAPIVLMADCGTVGGYPKIATVISVDRGRLAQMRVGAEFEFAEVSVDEAQKSLSEEAQLLRGFETESGG